MFGAPDFHGASIAEHFTLIFIIADTEGGFFSQVSGPGSRIHALSKLPLLLERIICGVEASALGDRRNHHFLTIRLNYFSRQFEAC